MTDKIISGYDGDAFVKLVDEMVQLASTCNADTSTFSAVRPDGWTVEITVKAPKKETEAELKEKATKAALKTAQGNAVARVVGETDREN